MTRKKPRSAGRSTCKRALLLVFALAWLVPCLRAETKLAENMTINSGAENAFWELALLFLAAPYGIAHDLEHVGLPRFP